MFLLSDMVVKLFKSLIGLILFILFFQNFIFSSDLGYLNFREVDDTAFQIVVRRMHLSILDGNIREFFSVVDYGYGWIYWLAVCIASLPGFFLSHYYEFDSILIVAPRQLSLLFVIFTAFAIFKIALLLSADRLVALFCVLLFIFNPLTGYYSMRFGTVTPVLFFSTLALYQSLKHDSLTKLGLAKILASLTIASAIKLTGLLIVPLIVALLWIKYLNSKEINFSEFYSGKTFIAILLLFLLFIFLISPLVFYEPAYFEHVARTILFFISTGSDSGSIRDPIGVIQNALLYSTPALVLHFILFSLLFVNFFLASKSESLIYLAFFIYSVFIFAFLSFFVSNGAAFGRFFNSIGVVLVFSPILVCMGRFRKFWLILIFITIMADFSIKSISSINGNSLSFGHFSYFSKLNNSDQAIENAKAIDTCLMNNQVFTEGHIILDHSVPSFVNPMTYKGCITYVFDNLNFNALYCTEKPSFIILDKVRRGFLNDKDYLNATSGLGVRGLEIALADRDARAILLTEGSAGNLNYKLICDLEQSYVFGVQP